jgi:hypothetical protein
MNESMFQFKENTWNHVFQVKKKKKKTSSFNWFDLGEATNQRVIIRLYYN